MPDWDTVQGFGAEGGDPDHDIRDPAGHCGSAFGEQAKPKPLCKIAQETGEVPLDCLFGCARGCTSGRDVRAEERSGYGTPYVPTVCKFCGSTDVRWRQQTGRWVLFSTTPGVEHNCRSQPASADEFDEVTP